MTATALQSIEADLDRLERQRVGYALALASSTDERTRTRHERTLRRLDEEIGALQGAAAAMADSPPAVHGTSFGVPVIERTAEFTAEEYDEAVASTRPRWLWPSVAAGLVLVATAAYWLSRPAPPPTPAPATAPASVIITSPVPPDSHR